MGVGAALSAAIVSAGLLAAGLVTQRVLDKRAQPKGDLIVAASSMLFIKKAGLLEPYRPNGLEALRTSFLDPTEPYSFTGLDVYAPVICLNPDKARADHIGRPQVWRDPLAPKLKGRIVMADPAASGTGFGLLAGRMQSMGEGQA